MTAPYLPLDAYSNCGFKVYALDVGLLSTMSGLPPEVVLDGARIYREFKGALTEQYVCQQLLAETDYKPCYWSTEDSRTEIDFVIQNGMEVCPLEVKAGGNVQSQSLKSYVRKYHPGIVCRISMLPVEEQKLVLDETLSSTLYNLPLYAVSQLPEILSRNR